MTTLNLDRLDLEELVLALQQQDDYDSRWLIDPATGEIHYWTSDLGLDGSGTPVDIEELDMVPIRPLPSRVWHQDMADFAEGIGDERASRRLTRAIRGRGAFRMFKDELREEHPELLDSWYAFRDARALHRRRVAGRHSRRHPRFRRVIVAVATITLQTWGRSATMPRCVSPLTTPTTWSGCCFANAVSSPGSKL